MKSDTERKKYYSEKLHMKKKRMNAHLSKDLRGKLKSKRRSLQLHRGDVVKVMRGPHKGKETKVVKVNTVARKVYLEGVTVTTARNREVLMPIQPSNLLLTGLEPTPERKKVFSEEAFKKPKIEKKEEPKAEEKKPEEAKAEAKEAKPEAKTEAPAKPAPVKADAPKPPAAAKPSTKE